MLFHVVHLTMCFFDALQRRHRVFPMHYSDDVGYFRYIT